MNKRVAGNELSVREEEHEVDGRTPSRSLDAVSFAEPPVRASGEAPSRERAAEGL